MPFVLQRDFTSHPDLVKRLVYSKYLFNRARLLQQQGNELASAEAVLTAHDSVEILMRVVTDYLDTNPAREFMKFWNVIKEKKGTEPPHKNAMGRLNNLRVGYKHMGNLPNPSVVTDLMPSVAAFCADVTAQYLGHDYATVSLADLVQNAAAREKVKEAEVAKRAGNIKDAILALRMAFDTLHNEARSRHKSILIQDIVFATILAPRLDPIFEPLVKTLKLDKLLFNVHQLVETMNGILLGIEPARFRRFSEITPMRWHMPFVTTAIYSWRTKNPELVPEDFDFCHQFVIDFALRLASAR